MSLLDEIDGLADVIKRRIAEFIWKDIGFYLDNDLINWNIMIPVKGQPYVERSWYGPLYSTLPLMERDNVNVGGRRARLVIVHPQYNGIVETGFDTKRLFGEAMWYSLLHMISNDYCCQWDPNESRECMIHEFDRSFKPVWATSIHHLLHSHSLGYMRAKMGTTTVTQQAHWNDGDVGEYYGGNGGLFALHEEVMDRVQLQLENELHISHQQSEYFTNNDEFEGRFIEVMRSAVLLTENIIDNIMEDEVKLANHINRMIVGDSNSIEQE
jgi:hypothetical protein